MHYCIISAGEGSRLVSEGVSVPKPLVSIAGQPMIGRLMDIMSRCHCESINVIVNEQMTEVADFVRAYAEKSAIPISLVVKSTPSSMHSFYELSSIIPAGKFVLTTVDTIFREDDFADYIDAFSRNDYYDAFMAVTTNIDDEKPLYVETDRNMRITAFCDTPGEHPRYVSGGIYGLNDRSKEVLNECIAAGKSRMRNFQRELLTHGLHAKAWDIGTIIDVDHSSDVDKANAFVAQ